LDKTLYFLNQSVTVYALNLWWYYSFQKLAEGKKFCIGNDMADSNTAYPHTAITTWSGFVYQGKVAISHVVHLLENSVACTGYTLQLDSLEDFTILDSAGTVISLHQVKAKKSQHYSTYKEAFEKLTQNANDQGCNNAQFHLAQEITDKTVQEIATSHSPLSIYKYGQDHCCPVDQIDLKIEEKLKVLLANLYR